MKKVLLIGIIAIMIAVSVLAGCSPAADGRAGDDFYAQTVSADAPMDASAMDMDYEEEYEAEFEDEMAEMGKDAADDSGGLGMENGSSILEPSVERKIIFEGDVTARTKNFDEDYDMILDTLAQVGGYVENANVNGTKPEDWQDQGRWASITLRVPSAKFDSFIAMLGDVGQTESSSVRGRDISLQYFDTETRLATLRIREERLQELLKQATGLEDIIELERELANVSYEIQSYELSLRNFDSLVDFSTINVTLQEVHEIAEITPPEEDLGTRISSGFFKVINALEDFGSWLLVVITAGFPIILIVAAIVILIVVLVKRRNRRHRAEQGLPEKPKRAKKGDKKDEK